MNPMSAEATVAHLPRPIVFPEVSETATTIQSAEATRIENITDSTRSSCASRIPCHAVSRPCAARFPPRGPPGGKDLACPLDRSRHRAPLRQDLIGWRPRRGRTGTPPNRIGVPGRLIKEYDGPGVHCGCSTVARCRPTWRLPAHALLEVLDPSKTKASKTPP